MRLDFSEHFEAQDMISIIERDKNLSAEDAICFSINEKTYRSIVEAGWASIALSMWGHDEPEREWETMETPCLEIAFDEPKLDLISKIMKKERIDAETAISYFLLFTVNSMGYHI